MGVSLLGAAPLQEQVIRNTKRIRLLNFHNNGDTTSHSHNFDRAGVINLTLMPKGDLHKKLPDIEDTLTFIVFGYIKYINDLAILKNFLRKVRIGRDGKENIEFEQKVKAIDSVDYIFWQQNKNQEPDIIITCNKGEWTIIIEAKYGAPKGIGPEETSDEKSRSPEKIGDQLAKYYILTREESRTKDVYLLYVTHHSTFPDEDIKSSIEILKNEGYPESETRIGWLPWRHLTPIIEDILNKGAGNLDPGKRALLEDLHAYLENRGLDCFSGEWGKGLDPLPPLLKRIFYFKRFRGDWGDRLEPLSPKSKIVFYNIVKTG